jgi:LytS/YehU family sensor histidine kinase
MQKVTLEQEVAALKLYLEIEQVRFEDRLQLEFEIEPAAGKALIPSLILQPLVENSIKYAIAQSEEGGTIRLVARVFAQELLLELSDEGPGIADLDHPQSTEGGVGLTNTRERLRELYGDDHNFKLENLSPHGLKVCIRIPCETA